MTPKARTAAATVVAAASRRSHPLPEPLQRRASSVDRVVLEKGVHLTPWFGRFGGHLVLATLSSPATTRQELLDQLRLVDAALVKGVHEAGLPEGTSTLAVLRSESDPELRVATPELVNKRALAAEGFGGTQVSQVVTLEKEAAPVGGDAQPQDVDLPER